ncbi:DinB family protein [Maribacter polysaccharolyticus]|uniref:DinB family protein n=1 Tax=Maribacter polysaccharolyticus TaxID=3020831 RepID=UPI00237F4E84|nr:DinB family protein [Maribacter polysaccharolyticus]MDE3742352.1 DinB family protein [Maribacter polysaccharolyticus]
MKVFFNDLLDYNFFCNKKLIDACKKSNGVPDKSLELFSHILNAHHLWNARILSKPAAYSVWQLQPISAWEDIHYDNQRNSFDIVTQTNDFEKRIDYENTQERLFTNSIQEMLFHIINHSTHHRAQIAMDFRANGLEPINMDYAFYKR